MKKILALALVLAVVFGLSAASAEASVFDTMAGMEWTFCSGVGAWSTDLHIQPDGSFTGDYHDSDMGDAADEYPNGTVYFCSFSGQMSLVEQVDAQTWKLRVDKLETEAAEETIAGGVRYIPAPSYGLNEGDELVLYAPGTPAGVFSEDMLFWTQIMWQENRDVLENWFLMNEKGDSGFVGYRADTIANPWEDVTIESLAETTRFIFGLPEGAENAACRLLRSENLAELDFTWANGDYCARIQAISLAEGEMTDISGMYYEWEHEEEISFRGHPGTIAIARDGDLWAERCMWYDFDAGLMYSLSVTAADVDGLDLAALAEQVFPPVQGDV